jgi:hypothetical protein
MSAYEHYCTSHEVIDFTTRIRKGIGFPNILMRKLPGNTAYDIWFDNFENYDQRTAFIDADYPSPATEKRRLNFLRSLATTMAELGQLHFDEIGVPILDQLREQKPPYVGPSYHWISRNNGHAVIERPTSFTTKEYIDSMLDTV